MVDLILYRFGHDKDTTQGILIEKSNNFHWGFVIEDQPQKVKVKKETRIPGGKRYKIVLNKELTGKTKDYRAKYPWFTWHIMLQGVLDFAGIYIHIGNDDDDTEGCLLLNYVIRTLSKYPTTPGSESTDCFKAFYQYIVSKLEAGEEVFITIKDENY